MKASDTIKKTREFAWHVHHNELIEPLFEPIKNRILYIKAYKPKGEQKLRLRLLKKVRGKLPEEVVKAREAYIKAKEAFGSAWEAYDKAREAYDKAWEALGKAREAHIKAWEAYGKAREAHNSQIEELHRLECPDCPWDGKTIFT